MLHFVITITLFGDTSHRALMLGERKPSMSSTLLFEVVMESDGVGKIAWTLSEKMSQELNALPPQQQDKIRKMIHLRLSHLVLIIMGLIARPDAEHDLGRMLDASLDDIAACMAELIEKPATVVH